MIIKPDYINSIYNIMQSIKRHYHLTYKDSLAPLDQVFDEGRDKVILLVLDGLGMNILKEMPEKSWLRSNLAQELTSVYPSTTTAAMSTFYSSKTPYEHGWLGWSLYFKEFARQVDTFIDRDSYTGEIIEPTSPAKSLLAYETIFHQIAKGTKEKVATYAIMPRGILVAEKPTKTYNVDSFHDLLKTISKVSQRMEKSFTMAYWHQPDLLAHQYGCKHKEVLEALQEIDLLIRGLSEQLQDTLLLISADHGLIDIEVKYVINDYPSIVDCLVMPPSIESRCCTFFVKSDRKVDFVEAFTNNLGDDFDLYTKKDFIKAGFLGPGSAHKKVDDFLGDFVAVATKKAMISFETPHQEVHRNHIANHAGMTQEEMKVPLIIYSP